MRRVAGLVVVGLMASEAGGRQGCVVAVGMAVATVRRRHFVRARKREGGVVVIKGRVCPVTGVMAELTCGGESGR